MTKRAIGNLVNRYRAVLKKCRLLNVFGSLLLAGGCIFGMAQVAVAEDVILTQKNIHFRSDSNNPDGYSKTYDGSLTIDITATGGGSEKNYNDEDFRSNEGKGQYNTKEYGIGALIWNGRRLDVKENLHISVAPADWDGSKYDTERGGIAIKTDGTMHVGGDTSIYVKNYKHSESSSNLAPDEDYGMNSQKGISLEGENSSLVLDGDLDITMLNGNRSMGIFATDKSTLTVGGNTSVIVRNAPYYTYGISNQYNNQKYAFNYSAEDADLNFQGDLNIEVEGGNNAVGINLKDSNRNADGEDSITVDGHLSINVSGAQEYKDKTNLQKFPNAVSIYGIFLNNIASSTFNTAEITTESTGERVESIGTYLYNNSNATFKGDVRYHTVADNAATEISVLARKGSNLVYEKGFASEGTVALNALEGSTIRVNSTEAVDAAVQITGNIVAGKTSAVQVVPSDLENDNDATENIISVNLLNKDSHFTGINEFGNEGSKIDLTFADGARWNMTGASPVSTLAMRDGGIVDLTYNNAPATPSRFRTLTADNLTGEGGIFRVNTDIKNDKTDQIIIGEGAGTHQIEVMPTGTGADREAMDSFIVQQHDGNASFSLANEDGKVEQGLYFYELADRAGSDGQEWYLKRASSGIVPDTPTGEAEASLSGLAGHYAMWYGQLTDLRKRLGEVRYGTQTGLWVRGFADKSRLDGLAGSSFTQNLYGGSIGYDTLLADSGQYNWIVGMQLRSAHADQSTNGQWGGHGKLTSMGGGLYSTWAHTDGWYVDAAATMDWYNHKIRATMRDGTRVHDDRSSYGLGASLEAGRKIDFGFSNEGRDHWFVEPQLQLSYFWVKGGDFTASNGMEIDQKDMDSLTGRAGLVLGKKFALDSGNGSRYIQPYVKAGLNHEFLGEQEARLNGVRMTSDLEGTRGYYGVGVDWQATDNLRLYMQAEREHGEHFTREYNVSAGLKWSF